MASSNGEPCGSPNALQVPEGSKAVQVGARIAVLADPEDDVSSLEIPEDTASAKPVGKEEKSAKPKDVESSPPKQGSSSTPASDRPKPPGKPQKQRTPLYPSVIALMHERGMEMSEADKIPASGPNGRLLKGDVLAYVGSIDPKAPSRLSERLAHLSHLDLSNIKIAQTPNAKEPTTNTASGSKSAPEPEHKSSIALPISFAAIKQVQKRVQASLGISVPLETFLTRAIEIANTDLPVSKSRAPTADELFDDIVGVKHVSAAESHGHFIPQIIALGPSTALPSPRRRSPAPDVIDILSGVATRATARPQFVSAPISEGTASSMFSLTVDKGEEQRAKIFLERMKTILQVEPGRLVI